MRPWLKKHKKNVRQVVAPTLARSSAQLGRRRFQEYQLQRESPPVQSGFLRCPTATEFPCRRRSVTISKGIGAPLVHLNTHQKHCKNRCVVHMTLYPLHRNESFVSKINSIEKMRQYADRQFVPLQLFRPIHEYNPLGERGK